mgnify:CR=1 FL=1|tara:strand:- start:703 stop:969 length:267 start_codon:yes stop_codon:yes gene_type:complete
MKLKEMIEKVQQHHPHLGETEIVKLLNRTKDIFCEDTGIYKKTDATIDTVADQRWYDIPSGLIKIEEVYFDDVKIPRLQGNPRINDES